MFIKVNHSLYERSPSIIFQRSCVGISLGHCPREKPQSSPASPWKTPSIPRECSPPTMCHMSDVMCQVTHVTCQVSHVRGHILILLFFSCPEQL